MSAYQLGVLAGHADKLLGWLSHYAWYAVGLELPGSFTYEYGRGYRFGQRGGADAIQGVHDGKLC